MLFTVTLLAATTCQKRQIRVSKETAVATATRAVDFKAERTQVRLVRQGLNGHPYWAVSLSIPKPDGDGKEFERLATVRVDANNGKLVALTDEDRKEGSP